ncbi:MAG: LuxR C-terminal-related transcriptional regulator [Flavobacteriaceae bacterium]|jgi:DNA-binding CsgD family transcriptional regulator|nr:LuxR C-terminal-related transcriptional regulator [Flavobacteriaceae bacterium]
MKLDFSHEISRKVVFLLSLLCVIPFFSYANSSAIPTFAKSINELHFTPLSEGDNIASAIDQEEMSWLQVQLSDHYLNKPLILQFASIHVDNYFVYIKYQGKWQKVLPNIDANGEKIDSQFQENHFITDYPTIYIKAKSTYINKGDFLLVERGEFRGVILKRLIKLEIFYSLYIISIVVNLGLYFVFRERISLIYSLFISSIIIICLLEDGLFYFISDGAYDKTRLLTVFMPISCSLFIFLMYHFLDIQKMYNQLKYGYITLLCVFSFLACLYYLTGYEWVFIFLINSALSSAILVIILATIYLKADLPIRLITYTFSAVAFTAMAYYYSIYNNGEVFYFIDMTKIHVILMLAFVLSGYALLLKVKKLKTAHDVLQLEVKSLKVSYENKMQNQLSVKTHLKNGAITDIEELKEEDSAFVKHNYILRKAYNCTDREIEVINCIWKGLTNQEIAEKLFISLSTTKQHVSNAYIKLNVKNRSQAMILKDQILKEE